MIRDFLLFASPFRKKYIDFIGIKGRAVPDIHIVSASRNGTRYKNVLWTPVIKEINGKGLQRKTCNYAESFHAKTADKHGLYTGLSPRRLHKNFKQKGLLFFGNPWYTVCKSLSSSVRLHNATPGLKIERLYYVYQKIK